MKGTFKSLGLPQLGQAIPQTWSFQHQGALHPGSADPTGGGSRREVRENGGPARGVYKRLYSDQGLMGNRVFLNLRSRGCSLWSPRFRALEGMDLCLEDIGVGNMTGKDIPQESVYSCPSETGRQPPAQSVRDGRVEAHAGSSLSHSANSSCLPRSTRDRQTAQA